MNKIYKVIWSKARNCYVAVSELAKNHGKNSVRSEKRSLVKGMSALLALCIVLSLGIGGSAWAEAPTNPVEGDGLVIGAGTVPKNSGTIGLDNLILTGINNSFAIGTGNTVGWNYTGGNTSKNKFYGHNSLAVGEANTVAGDYSVATGSGSYAKGQYSFAGGGTVDKKVTVTVDDGQGGTTETEETVTVKSQALGDYSFAYGRGVTAGSVGMYSFNSDWPYNGYAAAFGDQTAATGVASFAAGSSTTASGNYSVAFGNKSEANNYYSVAVGNETTASGVGSIATGNGSKAEGLYSFAGGGSGKPLSTTRVSGNAHSYAGGTPTETTYSYTYRDLYNSEPSNTTASGEYSFAFGRAVMAEGNHSAAFGVGTVASGMGSFAAGISEWTGENNSAGDTTMEYRTEASGRGSVAIGRGTQAIGDYSAAFGNGTEAKGTFSFAGGGNIRRGVVSTVNGGYIYDSIHYTREEPTQALGAYSFAFGEGVKAGTLDSTVEKENKYGNIVLSNVLGNSHAVAFGHKTTASGTGSFAAGDQTTASGNGAVAFGYKVTASGRGAVAMGTYMGDYYWSDSVGPIAEGAGSVAMGEGTHAKGVGSVAFGYGTNAGFGTGDWWQPQGMWDSDKTGNYYAAAFGYRTTAAGKGSVAFGLGADFNSSYAETPELTALPYHVRPTSGRTGAYGDYSATLGSETYARGPNAVAMGSQTNAIGQNSFAFGYNNFAMGKDSLAFGNNSIAFANRSTAFGSGTVAGRMNNYGWVESGEDSLAFGLNTAAIGNRSTAFGSETTASGEGSLAYGLATRADGGRSTASGSGTYAQGEVSIASGNMTRALGQASEAGGSYTAAYGQNAKAFGEYTHAIGKNTTAFGHYTTAGKRLQTKEEEALGIYTMVDPYTGAQTKVTKVNKLQYASMLTDENGNVVTDDDPNHIVDSENRNYIIYHAKRGKTTGFYAIRVPLRDADGNPTGEYKIREVYQKPNDDTWYIYSEQEQAQREQAAGNKPTLLLNYDGIFVTDTSVKTDNAVAFGNDTEASAENALAFGDATLASNKRATAFGNHTMASGDSATSFGDTTLAAGRNATTFGESTVGTMQNATAFGQESAALAKNATAFGVRSKALGQASTTWGDESIAPGKYSTAFGEDSEAFAQDSAAWGSKTVAGIDKENATYKEYKTMLAALREKENQLKLLKKNGVTADILNADGEVETKGSISLEAEIREDEAALTAKYAELKNLGKAATAFGENTNAIGAGSTAWGSKSVATGKYSTAFGESSKAYGQNSVAGLGGTTGSASKNATGAIAIGKGSKAQEANNIALGQKANAQGTNTIAIGVVDEAGTGSTAKGANSIAIGTANTVEGANSIAIGTGHTVKGNNSGAFGDPDTVNGDNSYVIGNNSTIDTGVDDAFVLGNTASVTTTGGVAIGTSSVAARTEGNGVKDSAGSRAGFDVRTGNYYKGTGKEGPTWTSTLAAVSVGEDTSDGSIGAAATQTRQITGVAAGTADTDAVNVAQLKLAVGGTTYTEGDNVHIDDNNVINATDTKYELETSKTDNEVNEKSIVNTYHVELREEGGTKPVGKTLDIVDSDTKYEVQKGETTKQGDTIYNLVDSSGTTVGTFVNTHTTVKGDKYITVELTNEDKISETVSPEYTVSLNLEDIKKEVNTDTTYTADQSVKASENPGEGSTTFNIYKNGDKEDIAGSMTIQAGNNVTITEEKDGDKSIAVVNAQDTTYQFTTVDGDTNTNVVSTTTVMSSTDGKDYKPTGETFKDTDTKITNVTVNAGKKDNTGNTPYTITLNDNGDNKEGASKLTATFNVQDTTYTANQSVEAGTDWKDGKGGSTTFTITDSSGNDLKPMTIKAGDNVKITKGANGEAVIQGNGLTGETFKVEYDDEGIGSVTIKDEAGKTATITNIRSLGGEGIADSINYLGDRINNLDKKINKVGAGAAALAGLHPLDFDPDEKWDFAASVGSYKSEQAVALGAFYRPNEDTMFSIGGTIGNGNNMVNVGVSWKFGQKNRISANRISSAKEIIELRKNQEDVHSFLADAVAGNQLDLSKIQLFPDVEENHWAYDYVATMAGNGVLEGYPDGYFKGNRNMTRYEMAAVLYRLMQNGARLSDRALTEFAPELDRIRVDTITKHKDGTPHIQRVRTIKERVDEKADPSSKKETKKKAKIKVAEKPVE